MNKILQILMWLIPALGLPVILGFAGAEQNNALCTGIAVNIDNSDENFFVDETDIKEIIYSKGDSLVGSPVSQINYNTIFKCFIFIEQHKSTSKLYKSYKKKIQLHICTIDNYIQQILLNSTFNMKVLLI